MGACLVGCRDAEVTVEEVEEVPLELDESLIKKTIAPLGNGFLVWERFRNGTWEIWTKKLNGGKESRLVTPEPGRDHFCPKVSPDGRLLAYMSYPQGVDAYDPHAGKTASLWLMQMSNRRRTLVAASARSYAEDRAVTWLDNGRLCFIDGEGFTAEYDPATQQTRRMTRAAHPGFGHLLSPDLTHATDGTPEFPLYDAGNQVVLRKQRMQGCQPYFTQDSKWGFWMGGAGGPVNRMRLATREIGQILTKDDPRLHGKRNYIYFPMVSPCGRLLAFAASPDKHDHFTADYDLYLAHVHPQTLDLIGHPVRYTKFRGCDRFPDVFRTELPLGSHYVEGETRLAFTMPAEFRGKQWKWEVNAEAAGQGRNLSHHFTGPGEYWVEARRDEQRVRGYVHVAPPQPPRITQVWREGRHGVVLIFSERVDADGADVRLQDGTRLQDWQVGHEGLAVIVKLPPALPDAVMLRLEGFRDHAQHPNPMEPVDVAVPTTVWPVMDEGLVFVWENAGGRMKLADGTPCDVRPHGIAYFNEWGAMKLQGGWFDAPDSGGAVSEACRKSGEITLELILTPRSVTVGPEEMQHILTLGGRDGGRNLTLGQRGDQIVLALRTAQGGGDRETVVARIESQQPHHLILGYKQDKLAVWMDGIRVLLHHGLRGDFRNWEHQNLRFGADTEGRSAWRGLIERVALYDRLLPLAEVEQHINSSVVQRSRQGLPQWRVVAKLIEASPTPTLQEFQPYTEALTRHLYQIVESREGDLTPGTEIAVSHWSWLHGQPLPAQKLKAGDVVELTLHREEVHEEVKRLFVKDELLGGLTAERYLEASDWDAVPVIRGQVAVDPE